MRYIQVQRDGHCRCPPEDEPSPTLRAGPLTGSRRRLERPASGVLRLASGEKPVRRRPAEGLAAGSVEQEKERFMAAQAWAAERLKCRGTFNKSAGTNRVRRRERTKHERPDHG